MKVVSEQQFALLRENAEVTAADDFGDKVLLLPDGSYLKLFRVKRLFTSARIFPYWRRFEVNALGLEALGIRTLKVIDVIGIPEIARTAVHYEPLPGSTLREVATLDALLVAKLGRFIRSLHEKGVYLRSMHLGNIVLTPEDELGLIDIADMKIHGRALSNRKRLRNFRHMSRYEQDRIAVSAHLDDFVQQFDDALQPGVVRLFSG
jgi:hypothetical protein